MNEKSTRPTTLGKLRATPAYKAWAADLAVLHSILVRDCPPRSFDLTEQEVRQLVASVEIGRASCRERV